MKIIGIITEYNPFHLGHQYQVEKARELTGADFVIVIMSGNFVQRGEPAFADKWLRTEMVLAGGVDAVIELPLNYAVASAEYFAYGAVKLLHDLNCVDELVFGSESGDIEGLMDLAQIFSNESDQFKSHLDFFLDKGLSYPAARQAAVSETLFESNHPKAEYLTRLLSTSNNILGIEYLKALIKLKSPIKPISIKRVGSAYTDETLSHTFASATAIRKHLIAYSSDHVKVFLPDSSYQCIVREENKRLPITPNDFYPILKYAVLNENVDSLRNYMDISEGLEFKIIQSIFKHSDFESWVEDLKSKRYPKTRIQRGLLHVLLKLDKSHLLESIQSDGPSYIRILGFRSNATPLLKKIKTHAYIPVFSNIHKEYSELPDQAQKELALEFYATSIYRMIVQQKFGMDIGNDYTQSMVVYKVNQ